MLRVPRAGPASLLSSICSQGPHGPRGSGEASQGHQGRKPSPHAMPRQRLSLHEACCPRLARPQGPARSCLSHCAPPQEPPSPLSSRPCPSLRALCLPSLCRSILSPAPSRSSVSASVSLPQRPFPATPSKQVSVLLHREVCLVFPASFDHLVTLSSVTILNYFLSISHTKPQEPQRQDTNCCAHL